MKSFRWIVPLLLLVLTSLACEINVGGPVTPTGAVPVSTEAVEALKQAWKDAFAAATDGHLVLVLTQEQLTSFLAFKLEGMEKPFFRNPQVILQDGRMVIYGEVHQGVWTATSRVVLTVGVDADGRPQLTLSEADFGPLPVPKELLAGLSAMLDEAFTGSFGPAATGLRIENLVIANGQMLIEGRIY